MPVDVMHSLYLCTCRTICEHLLSKAKYDPAYIRHLNAVAIHPDSSTDDENGSDDNDDDEYVLAPNSIRKRRRALRRRLPRSATLQLGERLEISTYFCPREFNRRMSPISKCSKWKAVETRQFFLYLAFGVFEGLLNETSMQLVSALQMYIYLLVGPSTAPVEESRLTAAEGLAETIISLYTKVVEKGHTVTLHNLHHIPQDCRTYSCHMEKNSSFVFENAMAPLRNMITSGFGKLEQLQTRLIEKEKFVYVRDDADNIVRLPTGEPAIGNILQPEQVSYHEEALRERHGRVIRRRTDLICIQFRGFELQCRGYRNSFCLIKETDGDTGDDYVIVRCTDVAERVDSEDGSTEIHIVGIQYRTVVDLFTFPTPSRNEFVYIFSDPALPPEWPLACWPISRVVGKMYVYPRFATLNIPDTVKQGRRTLNTRHLGSQYENVTQWIGVLMRHSAVGDSSTASLY